MAWESSENLRRPPQPFLIKDRLDEPGEAAALRSILSAARSRLQSTLSLGYEAFFDWLLAKLREGEISFVLVSNGAAYDPTADNTIPSARAIDNFIKGIAPDEQKNPKTKVSRFVQAAVVALRGHRAQRPDILERLLDVTYERFVKSQDSLSEEIASLLCERLEGNYVSFTSVVRDDGLICPEYKLLHLRRVGVKPVLLVHLLIYYPYDIHRPLPDSRGFTAPFEAPPLIGAGPLVVRESGVGFPTELEPPGKFHLDLRSFWDGRAPQQYAVDWKPRGVEYFFKTPGGYLTPWGKSSPARISRFREEEVGSAFSAQSVEAPYPDELRAGPDWPDSPWLALDPPTPPETREEARRREQREMSRSDAKRRWMLESASLPPLNHFALEKLTGEGRELMCRCNNLHPHWLEELDNYGNSI